MIARKFTQEEDQFLRDNCLAIPKKRMSKMLGRSEASAGNRMKQLGIVVPAEVAERFKKESFIKKGTRPFNKGQRMDSGKADGAISIRNSKGKLSKWIKVNGEWQQLHRHNWLKSGRVIPKGYMVTFKDGDPLNCELSNLECINRNEGLDRNKKSTTPSKRMAKRWRKVNDPEYAKQLVLFEKQESKERTKEANKKRRAEAAKLERRIAKAMKQKQKIEAKKTIERVKVQKERQQEKRFEMKPVDLSNLEPLRIDHKTIVYLKPGQDKQAVIEKYLKRAANF